MSIKKTNKNSLFKSDENELNLDQLYKDIKNISHTNFEGYKEIIDILWERYRQYADNHFSTEFKKHFDERFWEMNLFLYLLDSGYNVKKVGDKGPDILIEDNNRKIWIEAVCPTIGTGSDKIPNNLSCPLCPEICDVPNEKIILRFTQALSDKFKQYEKYTKSVGNIHPIVSKDDIFIIAINGPHFMNYRRREDYSCPRILQSVYPIGNKKVTIDKYSNKIIESGYTSKDKIKKKNDSEIRTDNFIDNKYNGISGILYSYSDIQSPDVGKNLIFIHNFKSQNRLPLGYFKPDYEYFVDESGYIQIKRKNE